MVMLRETLSSVYGVYRLARLDPGGLAYLDATPRGAIRSFQAAVLLLPFYAVVEALRLSDVGMTVAPLRLLAVEAVTYTVAWTAFPVIMITLTRVMGRWSRYCVFLTAYNWSSVVQVAVYFPIVVLARIGLFPEVAGEFLMLGVLMLLFAYEWYVIRTSLTIDGWLAAGLVFGDFILARVISDLSMAMMYAPV